MASFRKRGKKWEARISFKDKDGEFKTKSKGGFATKKEAQLFANENEVLAINGELSSTAPKLFSEYFKNWYEIYKEPTIRDRTKITYKNALMHLKKHFPTQTIEEISREDYQHFLNDFGKNHSKSTISKLNSLYHACVRNAVYDGVIKRDFIQGTQIVYDPKRTWTIEYLSIDEIKSIVAYIVDNASHKYVSQYMILTALLTGMRPGEIGGLTWDNINFKDSTITVKRSWHDVKKQFEPLKNESSYRTFPVDKWLLDIIDGLPKDDPLNRVFVNQGAVPTSTAVNKSLRKILKHLNIERSGFHFHSCRHSHVAYLLSQGIDLYAISKRLGHNDMTITAQVYAYLIDEYKAKTDEQIIKALDGLRPN